MAQKVNITNISPHVTSFSAVELLDYFVRVNGGAYDLCKKLKASGNENSLDLTNNELIEVGDNEEALNIKEVNINLRL